MAQLDAVLKSTGGIAGVTEQAAVDLAGGLQKVTKFSDEAVLGAESMLLTFTNIGKNVFPDATKTALDMSQALGQDLKTSAIQLGKSLNDPVKGIQALARVGVTFSDSQKKLIEQLVKAGKVEEAQKVILAELSREFGGSAVAAGETFSGQLVILQNRLDDLMERLGNALIPIIQRVMDGVSGLVDWFSSLDDNTVGMIATVVALGAALVPLGAVIAAFGTALSAVGAVIGIILSPIGLLIAAGALIVAVFKDQIGAGISVFLGLLEQGKKPLEALAGGIIAIFGDNIITQGITKFLLGVQNLFDNWKLYGSLIKLYAEYYFQGVVTAIQKVIDKVVEWMGQNPEVVTALIVLGGWMLATAVLSGVLSTALAAIGTVTAVGGTLLNGIGAFIGLLMGPVGLVALLGALLLAIAVGYPGGLPGVLNDAADAFLKLNAVIDLEFLNWVRDLGTALQLLNGQLVDLAMIGMPGKTGSMKPFEGPLVTGPHGPGKNDSGGVPIGGGPNGSIGARANLGVVPIPPRGGGSAAPRAAGGNIWAGMPYLTGERGPELITAGVNGTVHNADDTSKMLGGQHIDFSGATFNIHASSYEQGRAGMRGALDEIEDRWRSRGN